MKTTKVYYSNPRTQVISHLNGMGGENLREIGRLGREMERRGGVGERERERKRITTLCVYALAHTGIHCHTLNFVHTQVIYNTQENIQCVNLDDLI